MFTKDRSFYRGFLSMYWLLVLQNMIVLAVSLVDNAMLGNYDQNAMAGADTVNKIQFLVQNVIVGVGDTLVILSSQYWGQRRTEPIIKFSAIAMRIAVVFALLMLAVVSISPEGVVGLFTAKADIVREGAAYLRIVRFTYPVFAVTSVLLATMRSVREVKVAFAISLSTLFVSCGLNYVCIFGRFGFPEMGASGAAIGTLVARIIELCIAAFYVFRIDERLRAKPRQYLRRDRQLVPDFTRVLIPIGTVALLWGVNTALQALILGHLPSDPNSIAIAANSVASNLMMMLKSASIGAATAAAVVIGNAVGEGNMVKLREYTRTLQGIFAIIAVLTGAALFMLRGLVPMMYKSLSPETLNMTDSFLLVMCVTAAGMAYQMPTCAGIIRGGGDAKFCMINDIVSIYGIVLPVSCFAAFVMRWPPVVVVICLNLDQVFKGISAYFKCNSYTWIKTLTRVDAA